MGEEGAKFVGDRRNPVRARLVVQGRKLMFPEGAHLRVAQPLGDLAAEALEDEELHDVAQIGARLLEERQHRMTQEMLHARAPSIGPLLLQGLYEPGGDQRPVLRGDARQRVVSVWTGWIGHLPVEMGHPQ